MKWISATLIVPALFIGFSFTPATTASATSLSMEKKMSVAPRTSRAAPPILPATYVMQRKARIARVLLALDKIASATLQLKPETASRLEPVVVDLAEQAVDLSSDEALLTTSGATDDSLARLEDTVSHLVKTMNRLVEPEMSL